MPVSAYVYIIYIYIFNYIYLLHLVTNIMYRNLSNWNVDNVIYPNIIATQVSLPLTHLARTYHCEIWQPTGASAAGI